MQRKNVYIIVITVLLGSVLFADFASAVYTSPGFSRNRVTSTPTPGSEGDPDYRRFPPLKLKCLYQRTIKVHELGYVPRRGEKCWRIRTW